MEIDNARDSYESSIRMCNPSEYVNTVNLLDKKQKMRFFLSGIANGIPHRLNWETYKVTNPKTQLEKFRDVDSFLYTSRDMSVIKAAIKLYPFPNRKSTISKNYLQWDKNEEIVDIWKIPNYQIASFGLLDYFKVNAFFPDLQEKHLQSGRQKTFVCDTQMESFYNDVIHAAIVRTLDKIYQSHFPENYDQAKGNSRTATNHFQFQGKAIPSELSGRLFDEIRMICDSSRMYKSVFFHIHAKDLKNVTREILCDGRYLQCPVDRFHKAFPYFDLMNMNLNYCFYDFAIETSSLHKDSGYSILCNSTFASKFVSEVVGGTKAIVYPWSMTTDIGGAAAVKAKSKGKRRDDPESVLLCQIYFSDKATFFSYTGSGVNGYSPAQVLTKSGTYQQNTLRIGNTLSATARTSFSARVEYRVSHKYLIDNYTDLCNQLDPYLYEFIIIPTQICNAYKQFLLTGWKNLSGLVLQMFKTKEMQILLAQYIHMNTVAITKAPDPVKFKYFAKVFQDLVPDSGKYGRYVTSCINIEAGTVLCQESDLMAALKIFSKHFQKFQFGTFATEKKMSHIPVSEDIVGEEEEAVTNEAEFLFTDTPLQVMNVCLRCIWESLPHLVISQLDLTNPLALNQMDLENNCGDRIRFAAKSKITWRERFNRYFPTREDDILLYCKEVQGYQNLQYLYEFMSWWSLQTEESQSQFINLFDDVKVLPNTNASKLYYFKQERLILVKNPRE